jgi:SynChlorMet cassette protein ScmD
MFDHYRQSSRSVSQHLLRCVVKKWEELTMNQTDKLIANPIVVLREEFDDWAVLYNPDNAYAVGTNPVGVAVWKRLDGKRSLEDIVSEIKNSFEDTPDAAANEIAAFVDKLAENGFVGLEMESK